jgi:Zn-finger nucleic acid-binding protein
MTADETASSRCPVCKPVVLMRRIEVSPRVALFRCGGCAGVWAPAEAARSVGARYRGKTHPVLADGRRPATCRRCRKLLRPPGTQCPSCEAPQVLACLICGDRMARVRVAGVIVDRCRPCQCAWFDAGELGAVAAHARGEGPGRRPPGARGDGVWTSLVVPDPGVGALAEDGVEAVGDGLGAAPALVEAAGEAAVGGVATVAEGAVDLVAGLGDVLASLFDF